MSASSTQNFQTNEPHGAQGLPAARLDLFRMRVEEDQVEGTRVLKCRAWNGTAKSKEDYGVYSAKSGRKAGDEIFAARPLGGTSKTSAGLAVQWVEIYIPKADEDEDDSGGGGGPNIGMGDPFMVYQTNASKTANVFDWARGH